MLKRPLLLVAVFVVPLWFAFVCKWSAVVVADRFGLIPSLDSGIWSLVGMVVIALAIILLLFTKQLTKTRNVVILWLVVSGGGVGLAIASHWL